MAEKYRMLAVQLKLVEGILSVSNLVGFNTIDLAIKSHLELQTPTCLKGYRNDTSICGNYIILLGLLQY